MYIYKDNNNYVKLDVLKESVIFDNSNSVNPIEVHISLLLDNITAHYNIKDTYKETVIFTLDKSYMKFINGYVYCDSSQCARVYIKFELYNLVKALMNYKTNKTVILQKEMNTVKNPLINMCICNDKVSLQPGILNNTNFAIFNLEDIEKAIHEYKYKTNKTVKSSFISFFTPHKSITFKNKN